MQRLLVTIHNGSLYDVAGFDFSDTIEVTLLDLDTGFDQAVYVDTDTSLSIEMYAKPTRHILEKTIDQTI